VDVNGDGECTPVDALLVINWLNSHSGSNTPSGEGEADATDSVFAQLGDDTGSDDSFSALLTLEDFSTNRRK
jgi:hypothetical protein